MPWAATGRSTPGDGTPGASLATAPHTSRRRPVQVSGLAGIVEIAGGDMHAVARKGDGSVWTWGNGSDGQIGDGTTEIRLTPAKAQGVSGATGIAAGARSGFAVVTGGMVMAWGYDEYGQLGLGRTVYSAGPVELAGVGELVAVSAGGAHSLAVRNDGAVLSWGLNNSGQLGDDTGGLVREQPQAVPGLQGVVAVGAGYEFSLALTASRGGLELGRQRLWTARGGCGAVPCQPARVSGLPRIAAIAAGGFHGLAVTPGGKVWAWGYNGSGQVGNGTTTLQRTPVELTGITGVAAVAAGAHHSMAVTGDREIWVWGDNFYYQLGDGGHSDRATPYRLTSLNDVANVAAGWLHSMAVKTDRSLWSWGTNRSGQLGLGTGLSAINVPSKVVGISAVDRAVAGTEHSLALQGAAGISTWGRNWLGQLGDGTTTNRWVPNSLYYLNQVFAASCGYRAHPPALGDTAVLAELHGDGRDKLGQCAPERDLRGHGPGSELYRERHLRVGLRRRVRRQRPAEPHPRLHGHRGSWLASDRAGRHSHLRSQRGDRRRRRGMRHAAGPLAAGAGRGLHQC